MGGKDVRINIKEENNVVAINVNSTEAGFPTGSNIFSAQAKSLKLDLYVNLLNSYLTCYYHGGRIISKYDNGTFELTAKIPGNPSQAFYELVPIEELIEDITVLLFT